MFWNLVLDPGKRYSSVVKEAFHLSMAALDTRTVKNDKALTPVYIDSDGKEILICNLSKSVCPQVNLDLVFQKDDKITFHTSGDSSVHLTGYLLQEDDFSDLEDEEVDSEEEDVDMALEQLNAKPQKLLNDVKGKKEPASPSKRKLEAVDVPGKKKVKPDSKKALLNDDSDESSDDVDENKLGELLDSDDEDDDDEDGDGVGDSIDEEDDDDSDEEEEDSDVEDEDEETEDESEEEDSKTPSTPKADLKQLNQSKQNQNKTPLSGKKPNQNNQVVTNGSVQSGKKDKKNKNQETPKQDVNKAQKKANETPQSQKKQSLSGGVTVEELKQGTGPEAKTGKYVTVYYTGRLKHNNRVFDQSNQGNGFKFRLGRGEVIKGWDVGVSGMKVGSKRRITCPPHMAYGNKGSPPQIPPNSTLIFDVELKSVN